MSPQCYLESIEITQGMLPYVLSSTLLIELPRPILEGVYTSTVFIYILSIICVMCELILKPTPKSRLSDYLARCLATSLSNTALTSGSASFIAL